MTKHREENARALILPAHNKSFEAKDKNNNIHIHRATYKTKQILQTYQTTYRRRRGLIYHLSGQAIKIFSNTIL